MVRISTFSLLILACLTALAFRPMSSRVDSIRPVVVTVDPPSAAPNQTVTFTVGLSGPADADDTLDVTSSTPDSFSSLPATVPVPEGADTVSFTATLSSTTGTASVDVSMNGGTATCDVTVINPQPEASAD